MQRISVLPDWLPSDRSDLHELLNRVAGEFGLTATLFDVVSGGFSGAPVFRFAHSDGQWFAAKCFSETSAEFISDLLLRHRFVRELVDQSHLPLPTALPRTASSLTLLQAAGTWQVEPWKIGHAIEPGQSDEPLLHVVMGFLADLHRVSREIGLRTHWQHTKLRTERGPSSAVRKRAELISGLLQGELNRLWLACKQEFDAEIQGVCVDLCIGIQQRLPRLHEKLVPLLNQPVELQPVFRDVRVDHVLLDGGRVSGFIDLSLLATDHVLLDVTRLLRSWFLSETGRIEQGIRRYWEAQERSAGDWVLAEIFDECGVVLSPVTWLRRLVVSRNLQGIPVEAVLNRLKQQADLLKNFTPIRQLLLKAENG